MKKIGEGSYREVFLHDTNQDLCIKKLKKKRVKTYPLGLSISINQKIYTLLKFGIADFNEYEYQQVQKIREIIPENIPKEVELTSEGGVESVIKDYDGDISKNIQNVPQGKIGKVFFKELKTIIDTLMENDIDLMDIKNNIIVQEYEKGKYKPMLFDFKRIGWKTYWGQFWLVLKQQRKDKIYRRVNKLKNQFILNEGSN